MDKRTTRKRLEAERARLSGIRAGVLVDLGSGSGLPAHGGELSSRDQHPADIGTEVFEQEKAHSILSSVESELAEIERALERVADGSYGLCEACRKPIGAARIAAVPHARFCLKDQALAEREARAS
jgi:RNA polymerase-binding transcription factor DksA